MNRIKNGADFCLSGVSPSQSPREITRIIRKRQDGEGALGDSFRCADSRRSGAASGAVSATSYADVRSVWYHERQARSILRRSHLLQPPLFRERKDSVRQLRRRRAPSVSRSLDHEAQTFNHIPRQERRRMPDDGENREILALRTGMSILPRGPRNDSDQCGGHATTGTL